MKEMLELVSPAADNVSSTITPLLEAKTLEKKTRSDFATSGKEATALFTLWADWQKAHAAFTRLFPKLELAFIDQTVDTICTMSAEAERALLAPIKTQASRAY